MRRNEYTSIDRHRKGATPNIYTFLDQGLVRILFNSCLDFMPTRISKIFDAYALDSCVLLINYTMHWEIMAALWMFVYIVSVHIPRQSYDQELNALIISYTCWLGCPTEPPLTDLGWWGIAAPVLELLGDIDSAWSAVVLPKDWITPGIVT